MGFKVFFYPCNERDLHRAMATSTSCRMSKNVDVADVGRTCGNTDSNFFALNPKIVPKLGNLRFDNSKIRETG
jgi:hypothetical protein